MQRSLAYPGPPVEGPGPAGRRWGSTSLVTSSRSVRSGSDVTPAWMGEGCTTVLRGAVSMPKRVASPSFCRLLPTSTAHPATTASAAVRTASRSTPGSSASRRTASTVTAQRRKSACWQYMITPMLGAGGEPLRPAPGVGEAQAGPVIDGPQPAVPDQQVGVASPAVDLG